MVVGDAELVVTAKAGDHGSSRVLVGRGLGLLRGWRGEVLPEHVDDRCFVSSTAFGKRSDPSIEIKAWTDVFIVEKRPMTHQAVVRFTLASRMT